MVKAVNDLGLESCVTLGMLKEGHAEKLAKSGLNYYNHNIDTSEEFYKSIITTRKFSDRLDTLEKVRNAGVKVCSGGIIGMGETRYDRSEMIRTLSNLLLTADNPGNDKDSAMLEDFGLTGETKITFKEVIQEVS